MTPKQLQAQTERNIKTLLAAVEKAALAIGGRFGDIDNGMIRSADDLQRMVERWAEEQREYMRECIAANEGWGEL